MGKKIKKDPPRDYPPIDLVYTWVDGSDPKWLNQKQKYLKESNDLSYKSYEEARYRNLEELKYSIRSADKFVPFVRKIFIVTADQIPSWLNIEHPNIRIVNHTEIFPEPQANYLPTFNSIAIEANLHRIPDLSEHFIYFNDDVFFGKKMSPEQFLANDGKTKVYLRNKPLEKRNQVKYKIVNNKTKIKLSDQYNYRDSMYYTHLFLNQHVKFERSRLTVQHVGYLMQKSVLAEIEELLRQHNHFDSTCTRFRQNQNINLIPFFYPHYCLAKGYAIASNSIKTQNISQDHDNHYQSILSQRPHLFCLNSLPKKNKALKKFWKIYFPNKSQYEK